MAEPIVNENLMKLQTLHQEKIKMCLQKAEALCDVAVLTDNFFELTEVTLRAYFSIAADLLHDASKANQAYFETLEQ